MTIDRFGFIIINIFKLHFRSINFDQVGGLTSHIQAIKEIIQLPMLYPEMYKHFDVDPPKGVLFYGPPGNIYIYYIYI